MVGAYFITDMYLLGYNTASLSALNILSEY